MPITMIEWTCMPQRFTSTKERHDEYQCSLLEHTIKINDIDMMKFIINLAGEQQALIAEHDDDQKCYTINISILHTAIRLGRTIMLAEMIKSTGVGIPLNELIKISGIELKTKPRYYQGLSVGGKKRADWAQAPGDNVQIMEEKIPLLLQAAHMGSIDSVEWFMSDAPMRRYKEFADANKHDKRIKTLEESGEGFDRTIGKWLDTKSRL